MSTAGYAVVAVARGEVGYVEGPNNSTKYWDWWGGNYGPWCGAFVSWCSWHAGYPACPIETEKGYVLVSNGTYHAYTTYAEAQSTADVQPGDHVLFSWEPWEFRDGVPTCVGEWDGWVAGDHVGIVSVPPDAGGWFSAVEGNTSSLSYDNGGEVRERSDRHVSQVCGWYRPASYGAPSPPEVINVTYTYQPERTDIVGANVEGHVYHKWYTVDGGRWQPGPPEHGGAWEHITEGFPADWLVRSGTAPQSAWFGGQFLVFWTMNDRRIMQRYYTPGAGWSHVFFEGSLENISVATAHRIVGS